MTNRSTQAHLSENPLTSHACFSLLYQQVHLEKLRTPLAISLDISFYNVPAACTWSTDRATDGLFFPTGTIPRLAAGTLPLEIWPSPSDWMSTETMRTSLQHGLRAWRLSAYVLIRWTASSAVNGVGCGLFINFPLALLSWQPIAKCRTTCSCSTTLALLRLLQAVQAPWNSRPTVLDTLLTIESE